METIVWIIRSVLLTTGIIVWVFFGTIITLFIISLIRNWEGWRGGKNWWWISHGGN